MLKPIDPVLLPDLRIPLEASGPTEDPLVHLSGAFDMWGSRFNIECYRVAEVNDGTSTYQQLDAKPALISTGCYPDWSDDFERLSDAHTPDGGFQTVNIDGDDYAVFIYPASAS